MSEAHETLGWILILAAAVGLAGLARSRRPLAQMANLAAIAVALRMVGGLLRHLIIRGYYGRYGDAHRYYQEGLNYADALWEFDLARFFEFGDRWWGTQFINWVSGVILAVIGPNWRGEFLVFGLIGFIGSVCFIRAFYRSRPRSISVVRDYLLLVCLWPSLWFWPSSVGKEAVLLCGLGVAVLGYVGRSGRISWIKFTLGTFLVFAIRPHVATVFLASVLVAEWVGRQRRWSLGTIAQVTVSLVVFVVVLQKATAQFGFSATDLEGAKELYDFAAGQTQTGGSSIGPVGGGVTAVAMAYVNILFRPFVFEAHNLMAVFSSFEIMLMWGLAWRRRRRILRAIRGWRNDRFLRLGLPMTLLYVLMIGITFSNLGIIARQRVLVLPFLFALLVGELPLKSVGVRAREVHPK